jgi:20S proteasome alpha/beta subunit
VTVAGWCWFRGYSADLCGPCVQIYPHGSTDKNPYVTMGSGSLAAMSVFETGYREDMEEVRRSCDGFVASNGTLQVF